MDTIRAVAKLAVEQIDGRTADGSSRIENDGSPMDPSVKHGLAQAVAMLHELGMRPADDRATQTRLAAATDRAVASGVGIAEAGPSIMRDYMLQEAAAARMAGGGSIDPLSAISDPQSARTSLSAASRLKDMAGVQAHAIFDRASEQDMSAMASGRFDMVTGGNTAFALSTQLRMSAEALTATSGEPVRRSPAKGPAKKEADVIQMMDAGRSATR